MNRSREDLLDELRLIAGSFSSAGEARAEGFAPVTSAAQLAPGDVVAGPGGDGALRIGVVTSVYGGLVSFAFLPGDGEDMEVIYSRHLAGRFFAADGSGFGRAAVCEDCGAIPGEPCRAWCCTCPRCVGDE